MSIVRQVERSRSRHRSCRRAVHRGIVGIDIARPRPAADGPYLYRKLKPLIQHAHASGLGVTIHVGGEGGAYGIAEIRGVVSTLRPDRIGHGSWPPRT